MGSDSQKLLLLHNLQAESLKRVESFLYLYGLWKLRDRDLWILYFVNFLSLVGLHEVFSSLCDGMFQFKTTITTTKMAAEHRKRKVHSKRCGKDAENPPWTRECEQPLDKLGAAFSLRCSSAEWRYSKWLSHLKTTNAQKLVFLHKCYTGRKTKPCPWCQSERELVS